VLRYREGAIVFLSSNTRKYRYLFAETLYLY